MRSEFAAHEALSSAVRHRQVMNAYAIERVFPRRSKGLWSRLWAWL